MKKEQKNILIEVITKELNENSNIYITDTSELNAERTSQLRRNCFKKDIKLKVVKNSLLKKAMEKSEKDFSPFYDILKSPTSLMFSESINDPARIIKDFRKKHHKPLLKGAFLLDMHFIGDDQLDTLIAIKSKEELLGDIIALLQSPVKNVISGLQSGGYKIVGILKTLSESEKVKGER